MVNLPAPVLMFALLDDEGASLARTGELVMRMRLVVFVCVVYLRLFAHHLLLEGAGLAWIVSCGCSLV